MSCSHTTRQYSAVPNSLCQAGHVRARLPPPATSPKDHAQSVRQSVFSSAATPHGRHFCTHSTRSSVRWYISRWITEYGTADTMTPSTLDR
ncbi:hypothetical protein Y032_0640g1013 [Ancylostoma ceylanicum]|uniref:Uncharacterized protein n=1 Tax=Ancylostoma ceylanicum TaxID=53326 RepID=A0A016WIZ1_9BILA|nr:hypothetical protein Y032_0640g1013 [Ancylostoma ceylanicum]